MGGHTETRVNAINVSRASQVVTINYQWSSGPSTIGGPYDDTKPSENHVITQHDE